MFTPELDLRAVQIFLAVAEHHSVKNASSVLKISSPAISQTIQQLEGELGTALFYRDVRPLKLTAAGRKLQAEGAAIVEAAKQLKSRISTKKYRFENLRLGIGESATATISSFLLAELRGKVAEVSMESHLTFPLVDRLLKDEIDVLISVDPLLDNDRWIRREIYKEPFLLLCRNNFGPVCTVDDIRRLSATKPYVCYGEGSHDRVICDRYLRSLNIKPIEVYKVCASYTITGLVSEIDGWSLLTPTNALSGKTFLDELNWSMLPEKNSLARGQWVVGDKIKRAAQVGLVADLAIKALKGRFMPLVENFAPGLSQYIEIVSAPEVDNKRFNVY